MALNDTLPVAGRLLAMRRKDVHNWMITRINRRMIERFASRLTGDLLDVGCGSKPYEAIIGPRVSSYTGMEHPATQHPSDRVDVWGDATSLPFKGATFDSLVALQVLEHISEPERAVSEFFRVLRPDGTAVITTPFMWGIHEAPRDYYRYTRYGLEYLLERAGFEDIAVTPVCGYWMTAGLRLSYYLQRFARGPARFAIAPVQLLCQVAALLLDRIDRRVGDTAGYVTVARRPAA
jgi:SAM-dependent methyltransferase